MLPGRIVSLFFFKVKYASFFSESSNVACGSSLTSYITPSPSSTEEALDEVSSKFEGLSGLSLLLFAVVSWVGVGFASYYMLFSFISPFR